MDCFEINSLSDIAGKIVRGFRDDGITLTLYSDTLAGKRLAEFTKGCMLSADYFEFVELFPSTNSDMKKLVNGEWGKLYGPRLVAEKAKRLAEREKVRPIKAIDMSGKAKDDGVVATPIDPYGIL